MTLPEFIEMMGKKPISEFPDKFAVDYTDADLAAISMDRRRLAGLLLRLVNNGEWEVKTSRDKDSAGSYSEIQCRRVKWAAPKDRIAEIAYANSSNAFQPRMYEPTVEQKAADKRAAQDLQRWEEYERQQNALQNKQLSKNSTRGEIYDQMQQVKKGRRSDVLAQEYSKMFGGDGQWAPEATKPAPVPAPEPEEKIDRETRRTITLE